MLLLFFPSQYLMFTNPSKEGLHCYGACGITAFLHTLDPTRGRTLNSPPILSKFISLCHRELHTEKAKCLSKHPGPRACVFFLPRYWSLSGCTGKPWWCFCPNQSSCLWIQPVARLSVYPRDVRTQDMNTISHITIPEVQEVNTS